MKNASLFIFCLSFLSFAACKNKEAHVLPGNIRIQLTKDLLGNLYLPPSMKKVYIDTTLKDEWYYSEDSTGEKPKMNDIRIKNIATFISDLPLDTAALFIMTVEKQKRGGPEFAYLSRLNVAMMANDDYKNKFYDRMVKEGESKNESI